MPEQVIVPKLVDISFRQAQVLIENCGLQIGNISYQPSEYNDLVLKAQIDSTDINVGQQLPKGSPVNLIIGRNRGNLSTALPDLRGLTIEEASAKLTDAMLNEGVIIYDESVLAQEDSLNARIWKQQPNPDITGKVTLGSSVDLWVTVDQLKIGDSTGQNF